ncbi:MAG: membrane bound O-acyl transferase MBOAT family protein [Comamonadaceae bacterium]|nr:MAG: membrane bound O-acyl transferase MBOAT family protein [Comamonadaceae bacterium]
MLTGQFGLNGFAMGDAIALALRPSILVTFLIGLVCVLYPGTQFAERGGLNAPAWSNIWPILTFAYAVMVLAGQKAIPFLYFQF